MQNTLSSVNIATNGDVWQCNTYPNFSIPSLSALDLSRINKLEQIQLFFRHGLRVGDVPISDMFPLYPQPSYLCNITTITSRKTTNYYNENIPLRLKKMYVSNEQSFPNTNCQSTQSTFNALIQMEYTANIISNAYFGNESYQISEHINNINNLSDFFSIHTTDYDRSIGGLYALLVALFDNLGLNTSNWNEWDINILTHDSNSDPYLPDSNDRCNGHPQFVEWKQIYRTDPNIENSKYEQEYLQSTFVQDMINDYLAEGGTLIFGSPSFTAMTMQFPYCNGLGIPLSNRTFFTMNNFSYSYTRNTADIYTLYARQQRYCYEHTKIIPILYQYKQSMDNMMNNGKDRIVIHMAHSPGFVSFLRGLNMSINTTLDPPAMAEMVIFELYSANTINQYNIINNISYLFRFVRKGVTLKYPHCEYNDDETELCDLNILFENDFNDVVNQTRWENEICAHILDHERCGYGHSNFDNDTDSNDNNDIHWGNTTFSVGILIGILIGIVITLFIIFGMRWCKKQKQNYSQGYIDVDDDDKQHHELHQYQSTK